MLSVSRIGFKQMENAVNQPYQSPRQRVWVEIRKNCEGFTIAQVAADGNMKYESARSFISSLVKAGVVQVTKETPLHHKNCIVKQRVYKLINDLGYTAPEISKSGEIVKSITGNKLMWNTLRITRHSFDADELAHNVPLIVDVVADQKGAAWNYNGSLLWISPQAGLSGTTTNVSIGGGSDQEELEDWRARLLERKQLGLSRDREADLVAFIKGVTGVQYVYIFPKRRGIGSLDVAITAIGNPSTLPSQALLNTAQAALDSYAGFWSDCKVYAPTEQIVNVTAVVSGIDVNLNLVEQVVRDYFADLEPADIFQASILIGRIISLPNVTDVNLTPASNITPTVDWAYTHWLRLGTLSVSAV